MNKPEQASQYGFSLVEVLIVVVIIGVVAAVAILGFGKSQVDLERQAIVREFKIYLERARFDSVKRRADLVADQANLVLTGPSSFRAQIDFDEDRTLHANEVRVVDFAQHARTQIVVSDVGLAYPITIRFDQRGHVLATDSTNAIVDPVVFTICSSTDCSATSPDRTVLTLSSSGTVAVLRDGQLPSAAPTPAINTNTAPTINCYVLITNANTTCSL
ncbi:MAG: prepilin-type N-terminal cleavage/methylation domain-containing protein [Pyrinomonadaceae bacterium]